jgi:superoxide dismutase, Cu-Zn family
MKLVLAIAASLTLLAACGQRGSNPQENPDLSAARPTEAAPAEADPTPPTQSAAASAGVMARLAATQGHSASGSLTLISEGSAVRVSGAIQGLAPNAEFGFHIHEKGDCSAPDASSAGAHFNPANAQHGNPAGDAHHAGDMLNAKSDAQGTAQVDARAMGVTLGGGHPNDVLGKAIVLHEKADDYATQPSGNSGARIACGVITGR